MTDKSDNRERAETVYFWGRFLVWGSVLILGAWTQFLGQGVQRNMQDFLGVTELSDRLEYIEDVIPAPTVVTWEVEGSGQEGICTFGRCDYRLVASRTEFGDTCGKPNSLKVWLRRVGDRGQTRIRYHESFTGIELTRSVDDFIVPLLIPRGLPPGAYVWRSEVTYPHCVGPNEPIPRRSPWFPLTISQEL